MTKPVSEAMILAFTKRLCKRLGLVSIRMTLRQGVEVGWPDVLVLGPAAGTLFIETKAPGKRLRPIQRERRRVIQALGHSYAKPDTCEAVAAALVAFRAKCDGEDDA